MGAGVAGVTGDGVAGLGVAGKTGERGNGTEVSSVDMGEQQNTVMFDLAFTLCSRQVTCTEERMWNVLLCQIFSAANVYRTIYCTQATLGLVSSLEPHSRHVPVSGPLVDASSKADRSIVFSSSST